MSTRDKIKEAAVSHIVEKSLVLVAILVGLAWVALKPFIVQRILPALSKELLAGLLAATIILVLVASAYIFYLRKKLYPKLKYHFGVLWDEAQNPFCPKDKMPLQIKKANNPYEKFPDDFVCIGCERRFTLTDENGFAIFTVNDAKQKMFSAQRHDPSRTPSPPQ